ncbi:hypothetical protein KFE25_009075 [Diacronema lutheri]|uniref:Uncharacterized protein n=1 Tax=Diacronema lutheri TaxID=2081491 RepID=A0A8J5XU64_DIALT|nr:hypothetical protein KFE25_009075 [Diacronema lutheri]
MELWRDSNALSLAELDDMFFSSADMDDDVLRYLQPEAAGRSPVHGRLRAAHGRSPQRASCSVASPKRRHIDEFSALFAGMSPAKRFSPARGPFSPLRGGAFSPGRASTAAASPVSRARQMRSTAGVFAGGSEACFRGQRSPVIPLISPSSNYMPSSRDVAPSPTALFIASSSEADVRAFLQPTPTASPMQTRAHVCLQDGACPSPPSISPRRAATLAHGASLAKPEAERTVRRSPRCEQPRASFGASPAASPSVGAATSPCASARRRSPACGLMTTSFQFGARGCAPLTRTAPSSAPSRLAPATTTAVAAASAAAQPSEEEATVGAIRPSADGAPRGDALPRAAVRARLFCSADSSAPTPRRLPGAQPRWAYDAETPTACNGNSAVRTPFAGADSPGSDSTIAHTPARPGASGHFARRINFTPVKPTGVRTPYGSTALKRAAVFGASSPPSDVISSAAGAAAITLASLAKINSMLNRHELAGAAGARTPSTPTSAATEGTAAPRTEWGTYSGARASFSFGGPCGGFVRTRATGSAARAPTMAGCALLAHEKLADGEDEETNREPPFASPIDAPSPGDKQTMAKGNAPARPALTADGNEPRTRTGGFSFRFDGDKSSHGGKELSRAQTPNGKDVRSAPGTVTAAVAARSHAAATAEAAIVAASAPPFARTAGGCINIRVVASGQEGRWMRAGSSRK